MVGAGGVLVEVMSDVSHAMAPFGLDEARRLIERLQAYTLLKGVRSRPAANIEALAGALSRFSTLAATLGDLIDEFDVNPIIAGPSEALAVDVLVVSGSQRKP